MAPTHKPKTRKPSKVVKPQKSKKKSSVSTKNHRFKPFSERVANLKIDPIRRRRKPEDEEELREDTATYFGRSLGEWRNLNLSSTFSAFAREAAPLCDSLPVVLHNEEKLVDLLATYIEKGDGLALEPLLSLLSHFAHDLDSRFEKHFQRAVSTVTAVAAKHSDPAVVEWSFNCLAWLFKYLSRLLTPDLRPLYDLMAPYLGKEAQKPFIIRFAAESMSFLVRKAATRYEKDQEPLDLFVSHVFGNSQEQPNVTSQDLHQQGVMTLLTESIKGVQSGLHSSGLFVLQSMLKHIDQQSNAACETPLEIVTGTLTSLIHHTNAETFRSIQETVMKFVEDFATPLSPKQVRISTQLMFTIATVRKGTRLADWEPLVKFLRYLVRLEEQCLDLSQWSVLSAVAVVFQAATIDAVLPAFDSFEMLRSGIWAEKFLQFCDLFARLGRERFRDFLLPQFRKYLIEQCKGSEDGIFLRLPTLAAQGQGKKLACAEMLQHEIVQRVRGLAKESGSGSLERIASANIALATLPYLKLKDKARRELQPELVSLVMQSLERPDARSAEIDNFALGSCFACMLDDADSSNLAPELWSTLCAQSPRFLHMAKFWSNLLQYIKVCPSSQMRLDGSHMDILESSLVQCLCMPSHVVRKSALEIIKSVWKLRGQHVPDVLDAAISIESTPVSFETSRSISMNIRRLASGYSDPELDELLQKAIPTYCFGLLHLQLSQAWEDAINALAQISKSAVGEEVMTSLAQSWLEGVPSESDQHGTEVLQPLLNSESKGFEVASDFECSNFAKISAIYQQVFEAPHSGYPSKENQFRSDHARVPPITSNARGQALKVLSKMPGVAEKRSRMLVPVLLRWAGIAEAEADDENEETASLRWSRKDQKAMLGIFAQFTNPKVLFKSEEVYSALLNLCANGDFEIQRSALKAIFTWKDPAVNRYEEHLTNLLDEARFREEISVFLQDAGEEDEIAVRPGDYSRLMPVLLRLLYGRAVAFSKGGQSARRKAIFVALSCFEEKILGMFVDIALGSASNINMLNGNKVNERSFSQLKASLRQQLGMLNMLEDMLETLGSQLEPFGIQLLNALLLCSVSASRQLDTSRRGDDMQGVSLLRAVRQTGVQCLVKAFLAFQDLDSLAYARVAVDELIIPRLEKFASENTQSVSGLLRLLAAWAYSPVTQRYLIEFHEDILHAVAVLLRNPNTKDEVRLFILQDISHKLLLGDSEIHLTRSHITGFVRSIGDILSLGPSKLVLDACVTSFSLLSVQIQDEKQAKEVIEVCSKLLTKPSKVVSNTTKTGLLKTILPLVESCDTAVQPQLYNAVCGLFSRLQEQESRVLLSSVLVKICKSDDGPLESAEICQDLNAVGTRLDEPDHGRRETGFTKIYERYENFSLEQWKGIVHNCLFYVRDEDDLVNRTSASRALERFIDAASRSTEDFTPLLSSALLPGIVYGMKSSSELVRAEYLHLLGHTVVRFPDWTAVKDMRNLTANGDDEASFFTNVLHIQHHRRLRALRRLSDDATNLGSINVTQFFIPLLEHFVFEQAEGDSGRALADQTILTLGALSRALNWTAVRATFKRYASLLGSESHEKFALRLLGVLVDALGISKPGSGWTASTAITSSSTTAEVREENGHPVHQLKRSEIVVREILSPLMDYLHHKEESTVDRRMPVAITVVKVLLSLREGEMSSRLAPVLTDVCQVLRSRSQEARDQTRKTLGHILTLIGPSYLGFILKELRGALQRGYQLHVLSFTVHSLLVNAVDGYQPGDLDQCLPELISIVMDDIFGVTGQEKEAEEYKSGMKEVKSSKSFDTMELLARITPIRQLGRLIRPLQALLCEKLDSGMLKKIEDLLTRLHKGIDQNPAANSRDMLVFCHEIVRQLYADAAGTKSDCHKTNRYLIRPEPTSKAKVKGSQSPQTFRIVSFALNLLRKVLRRHEDLMTPTNLAGFLPIVGDALVQGQEEVQISALKLLSTIMKVSLTDLETDAPLYAQAAVSLIKAAPNMTTDAAKASLDLLTSILREKRSTQVRDRDLAEVLIALKGDLDEPDRQGIVHKFLRAVLGRKIMITELYDIMDEVGKVAVTNADRNVRESARSAYLQFVLEYPQSKSRWKKQSEMLVKNLEYEHPAGRQSIMELLYQLLSKIPDEMFAKLESKLFVPLIPVQATDTDRSCREMAGFLITKIFDRANDEQMSAHLELMEKWLHYTENPNVRIAALQCWAVLLRAKPPTTKRMEGLRDEVDSLIDTDSSPEPSLENQVVENTLQTFAALVNVAPDIGFAKESEGIWKRLDKLLLSESAAKLLGTYFTHLASTSSKTGMGLSALPLRGSAGLELTGDDMHQKVYSSLRVFFSSSENLSEGLVTQTVRNLVFLGRCFAANGMKRRSHDGEGSNDSTALGYLFSRLSYIVRQENIHPISRTAAIDCQAALVSAVPIVPNMEAVLRPLYSLTDPSIPQSESNKDLIDKARELLDVLQKKAGTEAYIKALGTVRSEAKERREDRRAKRRIEAVSAPSKRRKIR